MINSIFKQKNWIGKLKNFLSDSLICVLALVLMNVVMQFFIYPLWSRKYGSEIYGNIVYVMSLVNIFAVSLGVSANYARMNESATRKTVNGDYNIILLAASIMSCVLCYFMVHYGKLKLSITDSGLIALLCFLTIWRYYADVEYRLNLNYKGYFVYYAVISTGYILGAALFWYTDCWPLSLIPGEMFGLLLVYRKGNILNTKPFLRSKNFINNGRNIGILMLTNLISNTVFNGDRILLQTLLNGTSVTVYYLASLVGKTMSLITTPLNSVLIGYLARYKGKFSRRMIHLLTGISLLAIAIFTLAGTIGSHILIGLLYPQDYNNVKGYFIIANLTQIIYFVSNVITTVLLRIADTNYQLIINGIYAVSFLGLCISGVLIGGIQGFCTALLIVNIIRYMISILLCYKKINGEKGKI